MAGWGENSVVGDKPGILPADPSARGCGRVPKRALGDCRIWWQPHFQTVAVRKEIGPKCP